MVREKPPMERSEEKLSRNPESDSTTNVYIKVPMERDVVSVRIRPEIKEALKQYCSRNGLSICHVFEGLVTGFLEGVNQKIEFVNKSPTLNVSVVREVKRPRRYAKEEVIESGRCRYCGKGTVGIYTFIATGEKYPLCAFHAREFVSSRGNWRKANNGDSVEPQKELHENELKTERG
jgi:hypothetical protein